MTRTTLTLAAGLGLHADAVHPHERIFCALFSPDPRRALARSRAPSSGASPSVRAQSDVSVPRNADREGGERRNGVSNKRFNRPRRPEAHGTAGTAKAGCGLQDLLPGVRRDAQSVTQQVKA